jgi:dipeptide/tripeptide permease
MSTKTLTYTGLFIGSTIGSFIPTLWGDSLFGITGVLLSAVGGILGIIAGYKLSKYI